MNTLLTCRNRMAGPAFCSRRPSQTPLSRRAFWAALCLLVWPWPAYSAPPYYFRNSLMPPPTGMYMSTGGLSAVYANGAVLRNVAQREPSQSVPPPPAIKGANVTNTFTCLWEMEISMDGGQTFSPVAAAAETTIRLEYAYSSGGEEVYGGETLSLAVQPLPWLMIRESPTLTSSGLTTIRSIGNGHLIDSFFDIYTEVSTDGGMSWLPATAPTRLRLKPDPALIPTVVSPRSVAPMPNGQHSSPNEPWQAYACGLALRRVSQRLFTDWLELPPLGGSQTHTFDSELDFQFSADGGLSWQTMRAPGTMAFKISNVREFAGQYSYEAEATQLDVAGGELPTNVRIRESPTRASQGGATLAAEGGGGGGGGGYNVSSFFDIFTEISMDGGTSWFTATNYPARTLLKRIAPAHHFESAFQLTPCGVYASAPPVFSTYPSGFVISNFTVQGFSQSFAPPAPGETTVHSFSAEVAFHLSWDGGETFEELLSSGSLTVQATGRLGGDGFTEYYDTEMLQLDVSAGGSTFPVMLRESPTRASLGRTTATSQTGGGYMIDSFFDIYTEISVDGGASWQQPLSGPGTVALVPSDPLVLTCPTNMTVRATSPAGATVFYPPPTVSGGCHPVTVTCDPPSGSTFPLGDTWVSCVASDVCANVAECSFRVRVLRPLHKHFFFSNVLPPPTGMYVPPGTQIVFFANGLLMRNPAHRLFTSGILPPPPETAVSHTFGSEVEVEVSVDFGLSWMPFTADASSTVTITNGGPNGVDTLYGTEMLELTVSGGTLPPNVMIRESPTLASLGETRIEGVYGGSMIDSFFDIYLEVSLDGGMSWSPAVEPCNMELKVDPALIEPVITQSALEPILLGGYVTDAGQEQKYANGLTLRLTRNAVFTGAVPFPTLGNTQTHTFDSQLDGDFRIEGVTPWQTVRAPATMTFSSCNVRLFSGQSTFESSVSQLDVAGGDLPPNIRIRESPTRISEGGTALQPWGDGYQVSSFFDIFTEVSTDGGTSWSLATNGPLHVKVQNVSPQAEFPTPNIPPTTGQYLSSTPWHAMYACGIIISNAAYRCFTESWPPPPPGESQVHGFGAQVTMMIYYPGGPFTQVTAPANVRVRETSMQDDGDNRYFDTEMLQLDIAGGGLPGGIMIRESPTKASTGRTSVRSLPGGDYRISSFFDVFTELSTDGGQSWYPTLTGPGTIVLDYLPPLMITCPGDISVPATDWNGSVVTFPPPTVSGGVPPYTVACLPPSGSLFAIGVTQVLCQAWDAVGQTASCAFNVEVVKVTEIDAFPHSIARLTLQNPTGGGETITLAGTSGMETYVGPGGEADDSDANGRDDAAADLTDYALRGYSPMLGAPVVFRHASGVRNPGGHEETANNTPDILDVPPFTLTGTCDSFFDIFCEIKVGVQTLHPSASFRIQAQIRYKPPAPGDKYVTPQQLSVPLLDEAGKPTGYNLTAFELVPATTAEIDFFSPIDTYLVLRLPSGRPDAVRLTGTARTHVYFEGMEGVAKDNNVNGLDDVIQEMRELSLAGTCNGGPVTLSIAGTPISLGQLEETANNNLGLLDVPPFVAAGTCFSFFDVFYSLTIGGSTYHNIVPWRLSGLIAHKPCVPGDILAGTPATPLDLYDEYGEPTLVQLVKQWLALVPPDLDIDADPALSVLLSWPNPSTGYRLECCSNIVPPCLWLTVTNTPTVGGSGRKEVKLDASCSNQFFRLYRPLP